MPTHQHGGGLRDRREGRKSATGKEGAFRAGHLVSWWKLAEVPSRPGLFKVDTPVSGIHSEPTGESGEETSPLCLDTCSVTSSASAHSPAHAPSRPLRLGHQSPERSRGGFQGAKRWTETRRAHARRLSASCWAACVRVVCVGLWSCQIADGLLIAAVRREAGPCWPIALLCRTPGGGCGSWGTLISCPRLHSQ